MIVFDCKIYIREFMKIGINSINAFTLAEVLITLGIIGIVAAMTIPTLMKNTQDAELKSAFKRTFTEFSQVATHLYNDNGSTFIGLFQTGSSDNVINTVTPYFKTSKICYTGDLLNCWSAGGTWKYYDGTTAYAAGTNAGQFYTTNGGFILNDGTLVYATANSAATCNNAWLNYHLTGCGGANNANDSTYNSSICTGFLVDVNGTKNPNTVGRDIFAIFFTSDGKAIVPPKADCDGYGHGRAAQIISGEL